MKGWMDRWIDRYMDSVTYSPQVNKCSGNLQYTAVHLASYNNNINMMILLLKYGADLEIRNAEHLMPLALTTNYEIRFN